MLDSATNYECYKGLYSAFNSYEYVRDRPLPGPAVRPGAVDPLQRVCTCSPSADNHDVTRIASILQDKKQLEALYAVLFCMPGIPCVYYGSASGGPWGEKHQGDPALRPCFEKPLEENELTEFLGKLCQASRAGAWR